jgi:polyribonucleotide nucleotidyltransferase
MSTSTDSSPKLEFSVGRVANLTESSVMGSSGQTVALVTLAVSTPIIKPKDLDRRGLLRHYMKLKYQRESTSAMTPLTVEYRQRHHAVGKIPPVASRSDNRRLTNSEILASRAIDRALRPLFQSSPQQNGHSMRVEDEAVHLTCSIQACPIAEDGLDGGHPVALALNAASVALKNRLKEPVAAVNVCLMQDGSVVEDSSNSFCLEGNNSNGIDGELLFAGTKDSVVMMEFSGQLKESQLIHLISKAHESILPRLRVQEKTLSSMSSSSSYNESDEELRLSLGLDSSAATAPNDESATGMHEEVKTAVDDIYNEAFRFCESRLGATALRLFGVRSLEIGSQQDSVVSIHSEERDGPLRGKFLRGRRESLVQEEIRRLLNEFQPSDRKLSEVYRTLQDDEHAFLSMLSDTIGSSLLKKSMQEAAMTYGCRADGRKNKSLRPITAEVPALPDVVHGSALFTRGETQVLCTTTLGPPRDGILVNDPYETAALSSRQDVEDAPYTDLPVGSLRYLRNQEYLESDMNSRKVKASREQTGDSGTMRERRRAFLQYDFPGYSKGEVQSGPRTSASRREIGHGMSLW